MNRISCKLAREQAAKPVRYRWCVTVRDAFGASLYSVQCATKAQANALAAEALTYGRSRQVTLTREKVQ